MIFFVKAQSYYISLHVHFHTFKLDKHNKILLDRNCLPATGPQVYKVETGAPVFFYFIAKKYVKQYFLLNSFIKFDPGLWECFANLCSSWEQLKVVQVSLIDHFDRVIDEKGAQKGSHCEDLSVVNFRHIVGCKAWQIKRGKIL